MSAIRSQACAWMAQEKTFWIGGEWSRVSGTTSFPVVNPATEEVLAQLPLASAAVVDRAVQAAAKAFRAEGPDAFSQFNRRQRSAVLIKIGQLIREHREELAAIEVLTNGKTYAEAYGDDLPEAADVFDYYAGWTDKFYGKSVPVDPPFVNYTLHEPVGVVGLIIPWNFPLLLACWKLAPALAMGNTVILKPASNTSHSLIRLCELIDAAKLLPPGVINLIYGDQEPGEALSHHPLVDKLSFTGSTAVGRRIVQGAAVSNLKSLTLELGGKSPNIIFADAAHCEQVIQRSFTAMFCHKAEKCSEPTRFLIEAPIYEHVARALVDLANKVRLGDPFDPQTEQGPQANRPHYERILNYIAIGKAEGASLLAGGHAEPVGGRGFYVRPTIFGDVTSAMTIAREEIFGPVLCLMRFHDEAEAIRLANETNYGLAAGLYSADAARVQRVARRLDAGMVFINHYGCYDFASPFGGFKQSGWGKEMAEESLSAYTKLKSIWQKY